MADEDEDLHGGNGVEGISEQSEQVRGDDLEDQEGADETDELDEDQQPEEIDAQPPPKPSRGEARFQRLTHQNRDLTERLARLERENQEFKQRQQAPQQQQIRELTADEKALMTSDQLVEYEMSRKLQPVMQQVQQVQFQAAEAADRSSFQALCARDPRAARLADEVETRLAQERQRGVNIPRETLFTYLLGEKIRNNGKAAAVQRRQGQQRIARQQTVVSNPRSDQTEQRGRTSEREARDKRLANYTF